MRTCNLDFVLAPPNQPRVEVRIQEYPGESDAGPFPVPDSSPIGGWPVGYQRGNAEPQCLAGGAGFEVVVAPQ
jgi:hypothetical protein